jgi:hypothetical protein
MTTFTYRSPLNYFMVKADLPMRNAARGAKRKVPTPEPETAIPVARALYIQPRVTANIV